MTFLSILSVLVSFILVVLLLILAVYIAMMLLFALAGLSNSFDYENSKLKNAFNLICFILISGVIFLIWFGLELLLIYNIYHVFLLENGITFCNKDVVNKYVIKS